MAQKVHVQLVDDLDGTEADETVTFGLDGKTYEIDLNSKNAGKFRKVMDAYVGGARRVGSSKPRRSSGTNGSTKAVREWARANGYEVSDRGVIPTEIKEAYAAAH